MRPEQRGVLRTFLAAQQETAIVQLIGAKKRDDYRQRGLAGEIARANLRQLLPKELRQIQMAAESVHSPMNALQRSLKGAVKRELLGQDATER